MQRDTACHELLRLNVHTGRLQSRNLQQLDPKILTLQSP